MSDSFVTIWTVAHRAPLSMGFPTPEYWSGLPFPSPGDLPDAEIEAVSPALQGLFFFLNHGAIRNAHSRTSIVENYQEAQLYPIKDIRAPTRSGHTSGKIQNFSY